MGGQASRVVAGVTAIPMFFFPPLLPVGVACAGTALGLQAGISTAKAVHSHFQEECLAEAFRDDAILCERVLAAAGKLVDHLDTLEPTVFAICAASPSHAVNLPSCEASWTLCQLCPSSRHLWTWRPHSPRILRTGVRSSRS